MSRRRHQGAGPSFETQLSHFRNFVLVGRSGHNRIMKGGLQLRMPPGLPADKAYWQTY
jgi:hypothetical protein